MKEKLKKPIFIAVILIFSGVLFCCSKGKTMEIQEENPPERKEEIKKKQAPAEKTTEAKTESGSQVLVYVCGAVVSPGVYSLPENSRKYLAIDLAGGMTQDAASQTLNLAEFVADGEKIQVPTLEEVELGDFAIGNQGQDQGRRESLADAGNSSALININLADREALMTLPGIGEGKAASILAYRQEHGKFASLEELMQVEGIKQGVFEKLKDKICI